VTAIAKKAIVKLEILILRGAVTREKRVEEELDLSGASREVDSGRRAF